MLAILGWPHFVKLFQNFISPGPLIISCKRKEFNHYKGQTYSNFSPDHLASSGWKHYKSKGDYFTINAYRSVSTPFITGYL